MAARTLLSVFLAASLWPCLSLCQAANLSNTSYEVDIISPTPGGRYRVNVDRGIAVVVAVQNKLAAHRYGWRLEWQARSPEHDPTGNFWKFVSFGNIGSVEGKLGIYARHDLQDSDDLYIGLTHQYLYSGTGDQSGAVGLPSKPMPSGEYIFSWHVSTGPTCGNESGNSFLGTWVGEGNFTFTVADDAPWPDLKPTPCAAVAAQASFNATGSSLVSWVIPTSTPKACWATKTATESADPCRVTLSPEQARKVSSIMTWVEGAPVTTGDPSGSSSGSSATPANTMASYSCRLFVKVGLVATMFGLTQGIQFAI
ncbi:hypothetical protein B0H66DRAFT_347875 [Apodospora peruviana]|uniref:DUF7136 domain-containing protein n=1 Tax=Apodospora peruviana TaxID=516989 RepID=A0AAE0HZB2_9PEZI|nr:hypothetical protein B0H66DRAFT_347875 [Apodospora peruviana]